MSRIKTTFIFFFFLLAGIITGSLIAMLTADISILSWLSFGSSIGISAANPLVLDLAIMRFTLGFEMSINIAQIFCVLIALLCYKNIGRKI